MGGWYNRYPRVCWETSAQSIENKGREVEKERQESSRVRKRLEGKEIEEIEVVKEFRRAVLVGRGAGETMVRQVFTSDARTDYRSCQYLNWVLVFRIGHKAACAQGVSDRWKSKPAPGQTRTHVGLPKRTESTCPSNAFIRHYACQV